MSEPILLSAELQVSASAFQRWLKMPPSTMGDDVRWYADWSEPLDSPRPYLSINEILLEWAAIGTVDCGDAFLCRFDNGGGCLRIGAILEDGSTLISRQRVLHLLGALRQLASTSSKIRGVLIVTDASDEAYRLEAGGASEQLLCRSDAQHPEWLMDWIVESSQISEAEERQTWLDPRLQRQLKKQLNLGAAQASPSQPFIYDLEFVTDGTLVLPQGIPFHAMLNGKSYAHYALDDADPASFRKLVGNAFNSGAFYMDRKWLWYVDLLSTCRLFSHQGQVVKGFRENADCPCYLLCGNTLWGLVETEHTNSESARTKVLANVAQQGGIVLNVTRHHLELRIVDWLRPHPVDGASFKFISYDLFSDCHHLYQYDNEKGLVVIGPPPRKITSKADVTIIDDTVYYFGTPLPQADPESFTPLLYPFSCDRQHVWRGSILQDSLSPDDPDLLKKLHNLLYSIS